MPRIPFWGHVVAKLKCEPKLNEYIMPKSVVLCLSNFQTRIIGKFLIACIALKTYCSNQWFYNEQLTYDFSPSLLMGYYLNVVIFKCPCTYGLNYIYTIDTLLVPFVSSVIGGIFVETLWNNNFSFEWSLGTTYFN